MSELKTILFDFDGVLVDSLAIKTNAFSEMYNSYGEEAAQWVKKHHLENGGVSRFEKFKIYHEKFTGKQPTEIELNALLEEFATRVKKAVIACNEVNGAEVFLKKYYQHIDLHIITGTPTEEIVEILEERGWTRYFKQIMGSPEKKTYWVQLLQQENKAYSEYSIFVGDALADYEAALSGDMPFYLRIHSENVELFEDIKSERFSNFIEFENLLIENKLIQKL